MAEEAQNRLSVTIDQLPELVGKTFGPSSWQRITQEDINLYAEVSGDHNPIHVDPEAGRNSPFGTVVAHGYLTLSRVVPLMAEVFEVTEIGSGINYGLDKLRFPAPVPVDGRIRLHGTVTDVKEIAGGYQVHADLVWDVEGNDKPACAAQQVLRYYR
ncbi:MaoC family dehydratase [Nesterenkonia flava]|uniref:MaoC family dehydratase n=1 Tax=Nesterenkonia flava TaxID=469799 RepID=A0ABU1FQA3_9MICC|nr:MaoC family dehydratase [Nesterenkonia flava]MDR5710537.1 MaoC family dehydratase [Nesterenkonia flava]